MERGRERECVWGGGMRMGAFTAFVYVAFLLSFACVLLVFCFRV